MGNDASNMTTNHCSPHFHQVHGNGIVLLKSNTIAHRPEGFNNAIAFTDRPVLVLEPIILKIQETSTNWSGSLRIGFTTHDPKSLKGKLPAHSCPDLVGMPGNWVKAIPESINKKDSMISFHVDANGDIYCGLHKDKRDKKFLLSGVCVTDKLWGVIDVYGNTVGVELICTDSPVPEDSTILEEEDCSCSSERDLSFHKVHGRTVVLKENNLVATSKPGPVSFSYVFTHRPLKLDEKVIIQVLKLDLIGKTSLEYGITSCDPSTISPESLPEDIEDLLDMPDYWIVQKDSTPYDIKDTIMFNMSTEGKVMVMKNGNSVSAVFHVDNSLPLWLFFKLSGRVTEICIPDTSVDQCLDIVKKSLRSKQLPQAKVGTSKTHTNECVICEDKPVNCALYRCGHMCMCYDCALTIWKPNTDVPCPICRGTIRDVIKVYM